MGQQTEPAWGVGTVGTLDRESRAPGSGATSSLGRSWCPEAPVESLTGIWSSRVEVQVRGLRNSQSGLLQDFPPVSPVLILAPAPRRLCPSWDAPTPCQSPSRPGPLLALCAACAHVPPVSVNPCPALRVLEELMLTRPCSLTLTVHRLCPPCHCGLLSLLPSFPPSLVTQHGSSSASFTHWQFLRMYITRKFC